MAKRIYKLSGDAGKVVGQGTAGGTSTGGTSSPRGRLKKGVSPLLGQAGGGFAWNGCFDILPTTSAELLQWLGLDGSDGPDISEASHFWLVDTLGAAAVDDEGNLNGGGTDFDMSGATAEVFDPCFGDSALSLQTLSSISGSQSMNTSNAIPSPMDGTRSFIAGILLKPLTQTPAGNDLRGIMSHMGLTPFPGWLIWTTEAGLIPRFLIDWGAVSDQCNAPVEMAMIVGEAEMILVNADFSSLLLKIITSKGVFTVPFTDQGTFANSSDPLRIGAPNIPSWSSFEFDYALAFTLGYSPALDAELNADNMTRFLKFANGVLT